MPTTYTNGLKLPDLGSIDWFASYKNNIDILDPIVGTVNGVATTYAPISHNHSASEITSGTIDIARLPPAALERMHIVADQTARYALTTSTVQEGDTVKQTDTGVMYLVVDSTKLNSADGYTEYSAGTASKAIADEDGTSIKTGYVNVAGTQTVTGDKSFTGSNTFNNILPNATNTYSLGSSSYQWSSVYAQTYYYNGTAWGLDKANVWTGSNHFTGSIILPTFGSNNYKNYGIVTDYGYTQSNNYYRFLRTTGTYNTDNTPDTSKPSFLTFRPNRLQTELMDNIQVCNSRTNNYLAPITTSVTDLGTSTNKWKSFNGINPGALSFPDLVNLIDVSGSIVPPSGESTINYSGGSNTFMPPVDGWLSIRLDGASFLQIYRETYNCPGTTVTEPSGTRKLVTTLPVRAGVTYTIIMEGNPTNIRFHLYPCQGNV